ncbi:hypothetical protein GPL17_23165 [Bradyrhizobium yuanmingense]|uniref:hypothetical protein n=1 Tax=Bradyrhizobium yuanmingense TaxID=108015 RepID=UPI0012F89528|nr:hypothetical protein [Bradyrhizobium yuanmingense]MVT53375.1 hypothetical protein [Bradyrhizobium yuanmingense]
MSTDYIFPDLAVLPDPARHRWLRQNLRKGIILSDQYTMGIVRAITGAPAAYLQTVVVRIPCSR